MNHLDVIVMSTKEKSINKLCMISHFPLSAEDFMQKLLHRHGTCKLGNVFLMFECFLGSSTDL